MSSKSYSTVSEASTTQDNRVAVTDAGIGLSQGAMLTSATGNGQVLGNGSTIVEQIPQGIIDMIGKLTDLASISQQQSNIAQEHAIGAIQGTIDNANTGPVNTAFKNYLPYIVIVAIVLILWRHK